MEKLNIRKIAEIINAKNKDDIPDLNIDSVSIDSRNCNGRTLFVPIKGDRFDGHDFITNAVKAGAAAVVTSKEIDADFSVPEIMVDDTLSALQRTAEYYCSMFDIPKIGVTGSVGKTTTKEMIASVLDTELKVVKTSGNLNNQTGVPQTVFKIDGSTEAAVVEMGTNHFGEIRSLARMVKPNICIFTNIGESHIEFLGSKQGILEAKSEMLEFLPEDGHIIVNGDDEYLQQLKSRGAITCGFGETCDCRAVNVAGNGLEGSNFDALYDGETLHLHVSVPGKHMIVNALLSVVIGKILGLSNNSISEGISTFTATDGRMKVYKSDDLTVINDAYNANPTSVSASIDTMKGIPNSVLILGDMFELGPDTDSYHRQIGKKATEICPRLLICIGEHSRETYCSAVKNGASAVHFNTPEDFIGVMDRYIRKGDTVLIKASHGMHLETLVAPLSSMKF